MKIILANKSFNGALSGIYFINGENVTDVELSQDDIRFFERIGAVVLEEKEPTGDKKEKNKGK